MLINFVYKLVVCLPPFSIFLVPGTPWLDRLEEWAGREKTLLSLAAPWPYCLLYPEVEHLTPADQSEQSMAWNIKLGEEDSHMAKEEPIRVPSAK